MRLWSGAAWVGLGGRPLHRRFGGVTRDDAETKPGEALDLSSVPDAPGGRRTERERERERERELGDGGDAAGWIAVAVALRSFAVLMRGIADVPDASRSGAGRIATVLLGCSGSRAWWLACWWLGCLVALGGEAS
jgi:hypothetical protein